MKNYLLSAILVLSGFAAAFGQAHLSVNRPVLAYPGPDTVRLNANVTIDNNSGQSLNLVVERINKILTPGHSTYFCWTTCYDTSTTLSDPAPMAPYGSNGTFEGWVIPGGISGRDTVFYRFYDNTGASDTLVLRFTYDFGVTGIEELNYSNFNFTINGANPANSTTTVLYSVQGAKKPRLVISNLLGATVKEFALDPTAAALSIPTSELPSGEYVCTLLEDQVRICSKKLIVNH